MKKGFFLFFILLFFFEISYNQNITISGFLTDSISGEKLLYATVFEKKTKRSCQSNNFGFYSLTLPKQDTSYIVITYLGYEDLFEKIITKSNLQINFQLTPTSQQIEAVTVISKNITQAQTGVLNLSSKQVSKIPSLGGEKDLFKAFQLLPGVMQGTEGKSGLYVRGGGADQNLIILDDVALYSVDHFSGYFSVFNDEAINNVKLLKSGFPASYGGRLSSVMDVIPSCILLYKINLYLCKKKI